VSAAQAQPPAPSTEPETHPAPTTPLTTGNPLTENRFRRHHVQQSLTRFLRPDELIEHGRRLAAIHGELDGIDVELAGAKADAKQRSGVLEKDVIASHASCIDFQTGYLVTPAWRAAAIAASAFN